MRQLIVNDQGESHIVDKSKDNNQEWNQEAVHSEEQIEHEFTEEDFLFEEEEDEELTPLSERKWIKRVIAALVAVILLGNLVAFFPTVYNLPTIQFLKKTRQLSQITEIQQYKKAIVVVKADDRKGTGFNIDEQGLIITNEHVVGDAKFASISFDEGGIVQAEVIVTDPSIDIAILRIQSQGERLFPALKLSQEKQWSEGLPVYVIGNPLFFNRIVNEGTVLGQTMLEGWELPVMTIQAPIYKGNSGSPIIDQDGHVIAVVFATTSIHNNDEKLKVGLATPISYLVERYSKIVSSST